MAYTDLHEPIIEALAALSAEATGVAVCDWLVRERPDVIEGLRDRYPDTATGRKWTWRTYLGNALARMGSQGLVERVGSAHVGGLESPVWRLRGSTSAGAEPGEDVRGLTVRVPERRHGILQALAEHRGVSLQTILSTAVDEFVEANKDVVDEVARKRGQLVLLPEPEKKTSGFGDGQVDYLRPPMKVAGLFAGIGGVELGLSRSGHSAQVLCEIDEGAAAVLRHRFADVDVHDDVCTLKTLPKGTELLVAGFPCTDLSQAGRTAGIKGAKSGLVGEVFRLLATHDVPWVLLENVPFMLQLAKGEALRVIVEMFDHFGYDWAYRVVDSRAFGVPQRRRRVLMLAAKPGVGDPRHILLADDAGERPKPPKSIWRSAACGFYWTEGVRGLGWAHDSVPTLKAGSTIGIPSPPAVIRTDGRIIKPDIRDAERLQGFDADWTAPAEKVARKSHRWRLVGNAVTVDVAEWVGKRLRTPGIYDATGDTELRRRGSWPNAGWSIGGKRRIAEVSEWPAHCEGEPLAEFLRHDGLPLSARATRGFLGRARKGSLRFPPGFLDQVERHLAWIEAREAEPDADRDAG